MISETNSNSVAIEQNDLTALISCAQYALTLDGKGGVSATSSAAVPSIQNPLWFHFDLSNPEVTKTLNQVTCISDLVKEELLENSPIPKEIQFDNGLFIVQYGLNVDADKAQLITQDSIVTFRFFITDTFVISVSQQPINAIEQLNKHGQEGIGPVDVADWLIQVSEIISNDVNVSFNQVHDQISEMEDRVLDEDDHDQTYQDISIVRRQLIILRRLLMPQRDIFIRISTARVSWIDDNDRRHLHDLSDLQNHYINDIDSCLLRLAYLMEQISGLVAKSTDTRMYLMSLFTMIFMPLTFLASVFGVNLSGIPFGESKLSFGFFCLCLVGIGMLFAIWLKMKKWL